MSTTATSNAVANCLRIADEIYNQGRIAVIDDVFGPGYVEHIPMPPDFPTGAEAVKLYVTLVRTAFPDFHYTLEDVFEGGDRVVLRRIASGTQTGEFMDSSATGKAATWQEIHIARCVDGLIAEHWANFDQLGMLQQLGVIPIAVTAS